MPGALERVRAAPPGAFSNATYVLVRPLFSWYRVYRVYAPDGDLVRQIGGPACK
jgi:hypothetical protein